MGWLRLMLGSWGTRGRKCLLNWVHLRCVITTVTVILDQTYHLTSFCVQICKPLRRLDLLSNIFIPFLPTAHNIYPSAHATAISALTSGFSWIISSSTPHIHYCSTRRLQHPYSLGDLPPLWTSCSRRWRHGVSYRGGWHLCTCCMGCDKYLVRDTTRLIIWKSFIATSMLWTS